MIIGEPYPKRTPEEWGNFLALHEARQIYERYLSVRTEPLDRCVYFITSPGNRVKIGFSVNPDFRFRDLTRSSPFPLTLRGVIPGGPELERILHERFSKHRTKGEWFKSNKKVMQLIDKLIGECGFWVDLDSMPARVAPLSPLHAGERS